ncbi:MAG: ABC transporter permease DevC, partial [Microcystaceae cyanobacterium]
MKIPLAYLQLFRARVRLLVAIAGIGFADILMFMQLGFRDALFDSATLIHRKLLADLVLISPNSEALSAMKPFSRRRLYQTLSLKQVEFVVPVYIDGGEWKNPETRRTRSLMVMGFDPAKFILDLPDVNQKLDKIKLPDVVLFDAASRPEFGPIQREFEQGDTIKTELNGHQITVGGLVTLGTSFAADGNVIVSYLTFLRLFPERAKDQIDIGLIELKPGVNPVVVLHQLEAILPKDVKVLTHQGFVEFEKHYWTTSTAIGFIFASGTAIGFVVGIVIVYQILYANVSDHLPEYATLKAIGYRHSYLLGVVFQE